MCVCNVSMIRTKRLQFFLAHISAQCLKDSHTHIHSTLPSKLYTVHTTYYMHKLIHLHIHKCNKTYTYTHTYIVKSSQISLCVISERRLCEVAVQFLTLPHKFLNSVSLSLPTLLGCSRKRNTYIYSLWYAHLSFSSNST